MENKEIESNNALIAVFLGATKKDYIFSFPTPVGITAQHDDAGYDYLKPSTDWHFRDMSFHSSWDWLMPVVEKIEKIKLPSPSMINVSVEIKRDSCRIFKGEWNEDNEGWIAYVSYEGNAIQYSKITATYLAVVDFIKLYKAYKNGK